MLRRGAAAMAAALVVMLLLTAPQAAQGKAKRKHKKESLPDSQVDDGEGLMAQRAFQEGYRKALAASHQGRLDEARSEYADLIKMFAGDGERITHAEGGNGLHVHLYNNYGEILVGLNDYDAAEDMFDQAAELAEATLKARAKTPLEAANAEEAEAMRVAEKRLQEDPEEAAKDKHRHRQEKTEQMRAYRSLASIQQRLERFDDAVDTCRRVLNAARDSKEEADAYKEIGIIYLRAGNLNAAVQALEEAVGIDEEVRKGYPNLAIAYTRMSEAHPQDRAEYDKKAVHAFELALAQDTESDNASLHTNYGILLAQMQDYHHASMAFREALRIDKNHKLAKQSLENLEKLLAEYSDDVGEEGSTRHRPLMKRHIGPTPKV